VHVDALASIDSAYDRREVGASLDLPITPALGFHIDGSYHQTDDMEIPGFVASRALRQDLLADAAAHEAAGEGDEAEELREAADQRGVLPNSATETKSFGTGLTFFSGESSLGASFSYYDTGYGVPTRPGTGHHHEDEEAGEDDHDHAHEEDGHEHGDVPVTIGLRQYRADLKGVLDLGHGFFDALHTRVGYSDYAHTEFEGDEVGTVFEVEGVEGRVELVQTRRDGWGGSIGAQYGHTDFVATGAEAFVPPNRTDTFALFTVQELALDPFELEVGGRYEHTSIDAHTTGEERNFGTWSSALGLSYAVAEEMRLGVNASRAERAPSAQELFAAGPHIATQQFELGNADLETEGSWGVEAYLRGDLGPARISLSAYRNWFDRFIFLEQTGAEEDGLPVFRFLQQDADQTGVEGEISADLYQGRGFILVGDLRGDYVRATLADGSPVPRIPPLSLLAALEAQTGHFDIRGEVQWFDEQTRLAPLETPTESFTFVNLSLAWHPLEGDDNVTVLLQADNVFDVDGRRHASFTKDFVPLAGRNVKLSARVSF
jgi:iron complex outermembrane receptor protein